MKRPKTKGLPRGRPVSSDKGAAEAFDLIEKFRGGLSASAFAVKHGLIPSTVLRVLASRDSAAWTPTFTEIYRIAENALRADGDTTVAARLAAYKGPGETVVKRILADVEELVATLSPKA